METIKILGNEKLPSVLNDPFKKSSVTSIVVRYEDYWSRGNWEARGTVYFKNGDTKGEQKFIAPTFDEVVSKIKQFIEIELK